MSRDRLLKSVILACVVACGILPGAQADPGTLTALEARMQELSGDIVVVDVRRPEEWASTGLPGDATGITWGEPGFVKRVLTALGGDPTRPVALICRTGRRSAAAAKQLERSGFLAVMDVSEGMEGRRGAGPGWIARELPVRAVSERAR